MTADFRARLAVGPEPVGESLDITEGLEEHCWAAHEFADAPLGDRRLGKRLVESAAIQARAPGRAFSGAAQGDWPRVKGYYRMIDQPEDSAVRLEAILAPHRSRTIARMRAQQTVLCIQDGTDLNFSSLAQCDGLGVIGTNQTGASSRGLHLHSTLAVTTEGVPLGVLDGQCWAPPPKSQEPSVPAYAIPIEQKKGFCWIKSLRDSNALAKELANTRQVCVMDREADFFELFADPRHRRVDLLVRAKHDRCTNGELEALRHLTNEPGAQPSGDSHSPPKQPPETEQTKGTPQAAGAHGHGRLTLRPSRSAPPAYRKYSAHHPAGHPHPRAIDRRRIENPLSGFHHHLLTSPTTNRQVIAFAGTPCAGALKTGIGS